MPKVIIDLVFDEEEIPPFLDRNYMIGRNKFRIRAFRKVKDFKKGPQFPAHELMKRGLKNKKLDTKTTKKVVNLVDPIFIPSIRQLSEEFRNTNKSAINRLVSKYVVERVKNERGKTRKYSDVKNSINDLSNHISGEDSAFEDLKESLKKYMLDYGDIEIDFKLEPPSVSDLILDSLQSSVKVNGKPLPLDSQGMGYQRSLIFSLICNLADINDNPSKIFTLYLIEEPELFLHPNHQDHFKNKLMALASRNNQIILTSHSPYFLNHIENYSQLKSVSLVSNISKISEISHSEIELLCDNNGCLMADAFNHDNRWTSEEKNVMAVKIAKEDELRYLLWIDPNRANAFLSEKIILVEGSTDKAFLSFIFDNPQGDFFEEKRKSEVMVVDVNGKYHFYKFANLLNKLGVSTWIMHDGDRDKEVNNGISHLILNSYIVDMKENGIIVDYLRVDPELEPFIGIDKDNYKPDISIYQKLVDNENNCRDNQNYQEIIDFVEQVINY